jgi:hypothetical protein
MQLLIIIMAMVAFATTASAQSQQSPLEQALSRKLTEEINSSLQCNVAAVNAAKQIADLQKQIDDLKSKYEPAK